MNKGPSNKHAIARRLDDCAYSVVYGAMARLEKAGLVYGIESHTSRAGLPVETYDLTVPGFAFALSCFPQKAAFGEIVGNHDKLLPKILGKWQHFVNEGGEEIAKKSLFGAIDMFWAEYDWDSTYESTEEMNGKTAERLSTFFVMTPRDALDHEELERWYTILQKDRELSRWAVECLKQVIGDRLGELDGRIHDLQRLGGTCPQDSIELIHHLGAITSGGT